MRWFSRLPLGITIPSFLLALAVALTAWDYRSLTRLADSETERAAETHVAQTMTLVQSVLDNLLRKGDLEGARACIANLASDPHTTLALVVDDQDRVIIATDTRLLDGAVGRTVPQFEVATAWIARERGKGVVSRSRNRDGVVGYYPITVSVRLGDASPTRLGVVFVEYDLHVLKAQSRYGIRAQLLTNGICYVVAFVLLGVLLRFVVTRRVARLVAATRKFSAGDLLARADVVGHDELASLGDAFNRMAETIASDQRVLHETEERFRTLVEQAGDLFELTDLEGRLVDMNSATCRLLGYTKEELLQLSVGDIDPQFDRARFSAAMQTIPPNASVTFESTRRRKDGTVFPVEVKASVIQVVGATRVLSLVRDISQRKVAEEDNRRLQAQLNQAQKMESVGRLSGGVAHDFNNMLAVILGHTEIALNELEDANPVREDLLEIQKAAQHSAGLTSQLLAFARKQPAAPRILNLNDTVSKMLKMLQRLIGEDIKLDWVPLPQLWPVRIDPTQIDQIVANLCVNARDAISGVGKVTIETRNAALDEDFCRSHPGAVAGAYAALAISDTGVGMTPDVLGKIFEPFFTTKRLGRGTGLGLATVYGIVKQNEGFISVDSAPGQGATFTVYLPQFDGPTADATVMSGSATPEARGETVLFVEDEAALLTLGQTMLSRLGYVVLAACGPGEAVRIAEDHNGAIDLLVTDVVMPEMHGRDLADRIRTIRPTIKNLFISGYTADVIATRGVIDKGVQFLQKPFSMPELAAKVRDALEST